MANNKTIPTGVTVAEFLATVSDQRRAEAGLLIGIMAKVSGLEPVMWGPSIIGFGSHHYKHDSGREGDMARIGFSPRKAAITIYFAEGFDRYSEQLVTLGKHTSSVSCLYINKLADIDIKVLGQMIESSFKLAAGPLVRPKNVDEYIASIPSASRAYFDELRALVKATIPHATETYNYGIIGYKIDNKRALVFVSGWKDHVSMYPVPKDETLQAELKPHIKGKGTLWFALDKPLPAPLIKKVIITLTK
jgi:uncharacterized protein YdhG (YjbR/CyaY superfamily)